ncbi:MAG: Bax inhibitor-1 family protein [Thermoleophilia bacterium]
MSSNDRFDTRSASAYPAFPDATVGAGAAVDTRAVFGQTMGLVGLTTGFAAAGAYIGRNLGPGAAMVMWLLSLGAVFGMSFARRARSGSLGMSLLFATGLLLGMAVGPTMSRVASTSGGTQIIWEAAGLTGLFIAGFGVAGWATKRDLAPAMRIAFFALLALIVAGIVAIFVSIPGFHIIYSIAGLAIFSVFTMFDFQRLRHAGEEHSVFLALSIFLDVFNVFLLFVNLLGGGGRR